MTPVLKKRLYDLSTKTIKDYSLSSLLRISMNNIILQKGKVTCLIESSQKPQAINANLQNHLDFCLEALKKNILSDKEINLQGMNIQIGLIYNNKESSDKIKPRGIKKIILVSATKGGVGKSFVASHLAIALAHRGLQIGLLDADIYGPSIPSIFQCFDKIQINEQNGKIIPHEKCSIQIMSTGFFVESNQATIWRGPMLTKMINDLIMNCHWNDLDYLIIDTPPGTGDVHISLCKQYDIDGAILVSTPQSLALADLHKTVSLYQAFGINIIGTVQNMAYYLHEGERISILGSEKPLLEFCSKYNINLISSIPLDIKVANHCSVHNPLSYHFNNENICNSFYDISEILIAATS